MRRSARPPSAERIRGKRSDGQPWQANAAAPSHHTRLLDELRMPADDPDPQRARMLCAAVTRDLLGELAPALILLSASNRRRLQALTAYTRTLYDFALEGAMHGERLARINRWEFSLEQALEGAPPGQPVFVAMASTHAERPWNLPALDGIVAAARQVAIHSDFDASIPPLIAGLFAALGGPQPSLKLTRRASRLFLAISNQRRRTTGGRSMRSPASPAPPGSKDALPAEEIALLPSDWRRFLVFLAAAAARAERRGQGDSSRLGLFTRIRLLVHARFSR